MLFTIPKLAVGLSAIFGLVSAAGMITNCKPGYIALTYDDGPHKYTRNLVSLLNRNKVKATFFVNGHNFNNLETDKESQEALRYAYKSGHQIASHTLSHKDLTAISGAEFDQEIEGLEKIVQKLIGVTPAFLRPPYGAANQQEISKLEDKGYSVVYWSTDSKDYESHNLQQEMRNIKSSYSRSTRNNGFIVLAHDVYEQTTVEFTKEIIRYSKAEGYKFATVAECVGKSPYQ